MIRGNTTNEAQLGAGEEEEGTCKKERGRTLLAGLGEIARIGV